MFTIFSSAVVYGTTGSGDRIPSYNLDLTQGNLAPSNFHDALTAFPTNAKGTWAPTVRGIGTHMVMYYSDFYNMAGSPNCIGVSSAPLFSQTFTPSATRWCNGSHGLFDPQLFTDTNGSNYLLYSDEWGCDTSGHGCNSNLMIQPLSTDGLSWVGSSYLLLSHVQATTIKNNTTTAGIGVVENPSMTTDTYNAYDLTFSLGQYNQNGDYVTGETACTVITNPVNCSFVNQGSQILPDGGAAMGSDGSPNGNWMIYVRWDPFPVIRDDYAGSTLAINCNGGNC